MENTGERQVATSIDGIRTDHVERYKWAAEKLTGKVQTVYDLGCGVGYGSMILAQQGIMVDAVEKCPKTVAYAKKHFRHNNLFYEVGDLSDPQFATRQAAVCFEMIEHLQDPRPMLKALAKSVPLLLASVPNEEVFPYKDYAFHYRHYTRAQFEALLWECGWRVTEWFGQRDAESPVEKEVNGRTLLAVAVKDNATVPIVGKREASPAIWGEVEIKTAAPKSVAIIGLGHSKAEYVNIACGMGGRGKLYDEVWVINALGDIIECDRIFHMDDVRIQEIRAAARPDSNIAAMLKWMKTTDKPIMTSRLHPDYPTLVEMPLEELINDITFDYFNSTAAWAMAYAIHIGVEKVGVYGCDFTYPNSHDAEKGRGCLEFWMGYAAARGVKISLPLNTTLMDACYSRPDRLYGYDTRNVAFERDPEGRIKIRFEEVEELPTADEIEHRYDHSRHPNAYVSGDMD